MYRILIVDDEPLTRKYLLATLPEFFANPEQLTLLEAADGIAAAELMQAAEVDIVITDIRMPEMDGMQLSELIHERHPNTFIMLLSGYESFSYAHSAIQFGVIDYLLKPIVKDELRDAVMRICSAVDKKREEHKSYLSVLSLSQSYNSMIMQNLVYAAAHQENLKVRSYYELAHQLNLPLLEGEGLVLLFYIDLEQMLLNGTHMSDASVYQMILAERTEEILSGKKYGTSCAMPDRNGATLIFLEGEDKDDLRSKAEELFIAVSEYLETTMSIKIYAGVGAPINDILQLDISYLQARGVVVRRLQSGDDTLYYYDEGQPCDEIMDFADSFVSYGKKGNQTDCYILLKGLAERMPDYSHLTVLRYAFFFTYRLFEQNREQFSDALERSLHFLEESVNDIKTTQWDAATVCDLLYKLATPFFGGRLDESSNISQIVSMGKRYICSHFAEPLSLSLIAEKVNVSNSYFSNTFHKETGETYVHFLTRIRMENAVHLLMDSPEIKIYQIAQAVGYVSVKHFNHIFKQWFGVSPNEYQKNMGK